MSAYDTFPLQSMSLADSNQLCKRLNDNLQEEELIHFALSGIFKPNNEDGEIQCYQAVIDPIRNEVDQDHPLEIMRDYDSVLGLDFEILVQGPLSVYPVPADSTTLTTSVHIDYEFGSDDGVSKSRFW